MWAHSTVWPWVRDPASEGHLRRPAELTVAVIAKGPGTAGHGLGAQ